MNAPALTGLSPEALEAWLRENNEPAFRTDQILDWVWRKKAADFDEMSNLPAALRQKMRESFRLHALEHTTTRGSADTTRSIKPPSSPVT